MTQNAIDTFRAIAPLLLPELIDLNMLEAIDDYDDYVLMTFTLPQRMSIEDAMDCMEDHLTSSLKKTSK